MIKPPSKRLSIIISALLIFAIFSFYTAFSYNKKETIRLNIGYRLESSVTVHYENKEDAKASTTGSGVIFVNGDKTFVWTCHHVIKNAIDSNFKISFVSKKWALDLISEPIEVMAKLYNENGLESGYVKMYGKVIRWSEADDLALIELDDGKIFKNGVVFPSDICYTPKPGTDLFHIGAMGGWTGEKSISIGISGVTGIMIGEKCYDRVGFNLQGGSSGGGVFKSDDGECIGLCARLVNKANLNQGMIIPFRRMVDFAQRLDCRWAISTEFEVDEYYTVKCTDDHFYVPQMIIQIMKNQGE